MIIRHSCITNRHNPMDIKQLRALLAVAETGSTTRAAEVLHIVQPAISRQLQLLERDIGAVLFVRGRYGMTLTDAGERLAEHARRALAELDRARTEISPTPMSGVVSIGLLPSTAELLSQPLVEAVNHACPNIRLRLLCGYNGHLRDWLESGELDIALLYADEHTAELGMTPVLMEKLLLVSAKAVTFSSPVDIRALPAIKLILPSVDHGIRNVLARRAAEQKIQLDIAVETNAMDIQKQLVRSGLGATILPGIAISHKRDSDDFSVASFSDPEMTRRIVLATDAKRRSTTAVTAVKNILLDAIRATVISQAWHTAEWLGT